MLGLHIQPSREYLHRMILSRNIHNMMILTEQNKLAQLPQEFVVFRGHAEPLLNGISWTIDCDVALQYAIGSPLKSSISIGIVKNRRLLLLSIAGMKMKLLFQVVQLIILKHLRHPFDINKMSFDPKGAR
jgi:hypothetical protein